LTVAAFNLLVSAETALGASTLNCSGANQVTGIVLGLSSEVRAPGLAASARAESSRSGHALVNTSVFGGFGGSPSGVVDMEVVAEARDTGSGGLVSYQNSETIWLNLPVHLAEAEAVCNLASLKVKTALVSAGPLVCDTSEASSVIANVSGLLASMPLPDRFRQFVTYLGLRPNCVVKFSINLEETGIPGPAGRFAVRWELRGSFRPESSTSQ
jgi:hypothetical protein